MLNDSRREEAASLLDDGLPSSPTMPTMRDYANVDGNPPASTAQRSCCVKLWCNLWSRSIESNTRSLIVWQLAFTLIDVCSAVYSFAVDHRLEASDTWGLVNDSLTLPVMVCLILTLRRRHDLWLARLYWLFLVMAVAYAAGLVSDVVDLVAADSTKKGRSGRVEQSVLILVNDLFSLWLWVNFAYFVPLLQVAWEDMKGKAVSAQEEDKDAARGCEAAEALTIADGETHHHAGPHEGQHTGGQAGSLERVAGLEQHVSS